MTELNQKMVERRLETVASAICEPAINGLPGLTLRKLSAAERGIASRAYSAKLRELIADGGYFNEALLPKVATDICARQGLNRGEVLAAAMALQKRMYDSIPQEYLGRIDELTEDEVTLLSPDQRQERDKAIRERGEQIAAWQKSFLTAEDQAVMEQMRQIEALEASLRANTCEHWARIAQANAEILCAARRPDGGPYFADEDELFALADQPGDVLQSLYLAWRQFKAGMEPQFFRPDHPKSARLG